MTKGDVVLIPFPFTDLTGSKLRPAVVLIRTELDLTVCFITTQLKWQEETDGALGPGEASGIKRPSLIRVSKIATLDKTLALGRLGSLPALIIAELDEKLKVLLQLS